MRRCVSLLLVLMLVLVLRNRSSKHDPGNPRTTALLIGHGSPERSTFANTHYSRWHRCPRQRTARPPIMPNPYGGGCINRQSNRLEAYLLDASAFAQRFNSFYLYGDILSASVSVWKSRCSRKRDHGLSFLFVSPTAFFSPFAKSSQEL